VSATTTSEGKAATMNIPRQWVGVLSIVKDAATPHCPPMVMTKRYIRTKKAVTVNEKPVAISTAEIASTLMMRIGLQP